MNAKQKELVISASDLLASLSRGTLKRALLCAAGKPGGGYSSTVCVRVEHISNLHSAVEAAYPGLIGKARTIRDEWAAKRKADSQ